MHQLTPYEITQNPFSLIGKQWTLITTRVGDKTNAMTASWGGVGVMWGNPAAFIFVRPQRYTLQMLEQSEQFSLCFLPESFREQLNYCGSHSGRDEDKLTACGLTSIELGGAPAIAESELVLRCRKLYCQRLTPESFIDHAPDAKWYPSKDYHHFYIAEICDAWNNQA